MKPTKHILSAIALTATIGWAGLAQAADMQTFTPLPIADCGFGQTNNCILFGDFSVYSLALLAAQTNYINTGSFGLPPFNGQDPYFVDGMPGELLNDGYIVYGTGTNNNKVVTNGTATNGTPAPIDDAQSQPDGVGGGPTFVVGTGSETDPTFAGDVNASWDGTLSAVRAELAKGSSPDGQFVIYFNLNEIGNDGLDGIDLLAWFHVTLVDTAVGDGKLADKHYYLYGGNPGYTTETNTSTTAPVITNDTDPNWVYVHGTICMSSTAGFLGFGPCTIEQKNAGGADVNQNLGANAAAFAIFNQELSNLVLDANSGYDIIRGNWQFSNLSNGYEQQFSALTPFLKPGERVPEPGSLLLLGLGLAALTLVRSKKSNGSV